MLTTTRKVTYKNGVKHGFSPWRWNRNKRAARRTKR